MTEERLGARARAISTRQEQRDDIPDRRARQADMIPQPIDRRT